MICIGEDVLYKDEVYHVQDADWINSMLYIAKEPANGVCYDFRWVMINECKRLYA